MQLASVSKLLTCSGAKWSVSAFFAKGCLHITNSKRRKHRQFANLMQARVYGRDNIRQGEGREVLALLAPRFRLEAME